MHRPPARQIPAAKAASGRASRRACEVLRLALCVAFVAGMPWAIEAQTVTGRVTESRSGQPLAGVLVTLQSDSSEYSGDVAARSTLTDMRGGYSLQAATPGPYRVLGIGK